MFGLSYWHIGILLLIGFLLFGGKLSDLMGAAGRSLEPAGARRISAPRFRLRNDRRSSPKRTRSREG